MNELLFFRSVVAATATAAAPAKAATSAAETDCGRVLGIWSWVLGMGM